MLALGEARLLERIRSIGLYKTKARNILALSDLLLERHQGRVPDDHEALTALPGVGRKTANVVRSIAFGHATIAVDTHVFRLANRTGLAPGTDPLRVEEALLERTPEKYKAGAHHWLILHGRYVCTARAPRCRACWPARALPLEGQAGGDSLRARLVRRGGAPRRAGSPEALGTERIQAVLKGSTLQAAPGGIARGQSEDAAAGGVRIGGGGGRPQGDIQDAARPAVLPQDDLALLGGKVRGPVHGRTQAQRPQALQLAGGQRRRGGKGVLKGRGCALGLGCPPVLL